MLSFSTLMWYGSGGMIMQPQENDQLAGLSVKTLRELVVFGLVGIVGTGAHYLLLVILVEVFDADPVVGTTFGFVAGAAINYRLNHRYTFNSKKSHLDAGPKFFAIAAVTGILNTCLVYTGIHWTGLDYLPVQVATTMIVFLANFALNSVWTFHEPQHSKAGS